MLPTTELVVPTPWASAPSQKSPRVGEGHRADDLRVRQPVGVEVAGRGRLAAVQRIRRRRTGASGSARVEREVDALEALEARGRAGEARQPFARRPVRAAGRRRPSAFWCCGIFAAWKSQWYGLMPPSSTATTVASSMPPSVRGVGGGAAARPAARDGRLRPGDRLLLLDLLAALQRRLALALVLDALGLLDAGALGLRLRGVGFERGKRGEQEREAGEEGDQRSGGHASLNDGPRRNSRSVLVLLALRLAGLAVATSPQSAPAASQASASSARTTSGWLSGQRSRRVCRTGIAAAGSPGAQQRRAVVVGRVGAGGRQRVAAGVDGLLEDRDRLVVLALAHEGEALVVERGGVAGGRRRGGRRLRRGLGGRRLLRLLLLGRRRGGGRCALRSGSSPLGQRADDGDERR